MKTSAIVTPIQSSPFSRFAVSYSFKRPSDEIYSTSENLNHLPPFQPQALLYNRNIVPCGHLLKAVKISPGWLASFMADCNLQILSWSQH